MQFAGDRRACRYVFANRVSETTTQCLQQHVRIFNCGIVCADANRGDAVVGQHRHVDRSADRCDQWVHPLDPRATDPYRERHTRHVRSSYVARLGSRRQDVRWNEPRQLTELVRKSQRGLFTKFGHGLRNLIHQRASVHDGDRHLEPGNVDGVAGPTISGAGTNWHVDSKLRDRMAHLFVIDAESVPDRCQEDIVDRMPCILASRAHLIERNIKGAEVVVDAAFGHDRRHWAHRNLAEARDGSNRLRDATRSVSGMLQRDE